MLFVAAQEGWGIGMTLSFHCLTLHWPDEDLNLHLISYEVNIPALIHVLGHRQSSVKSMQILTFRETTAYQTFDLKGA
jgi:hypothetical protein